MENKRLYTVASVKDSIRRGGLKPIKSLGQNFWSTAISSERSATRQILQKKDTVLEIGPGIGTLTEELALRAKRVIAVEIDRHLIPVLKKTPGTV